MRRELSAVWSSSLRALRYIAVFFFLSNPRLCCTVVHCATVSTVQDVEPVCALDREVDRKENTMERNVTRLAANRTGVSS